jgi:hypothetical protein
VKGKLYIEVKHHPNQITISGLNNASQEPCKLALHVPATTKSSESIGAPIRSMLVRNGWLFESKPAITGSQNHGPNLKRH